MAGNVKNDSNSIIAACVSEGNNMLRNSQCEVKGVRLRINTFAAKSCCGGWSLVLIDMVLAFATRISRVSAFLSWV